MRAVLVLVVLLIWSGFIFGSIALMGYLGVMAVEAIGRPPTARRTGAGRAAPWPLWQKLLAASAILGGVYGTALAASFVGSGDSFLFAAGPALAFAVLAGISTVVARRRSSRTEMGVPQVVPGVPDVPRAAS